MAPSRLSHPFAPLILFLTVLVAPAASGSVADDADDLYRRRENLASAMRAADLWTPNADTQFDAAWKLSRVCYWIGTHARESERRNALDRGLRAGEAATRMSPTRPEGHFWLAANLGALAEGFGLALGLKYRGRIREELERVVALDAAWQGGTAEAALGRWYFEVPRLLGGSRAKAEEHLRRALVYNPESRAALSFLADVLTATGRRQEARTLLERVVHAPIDPEWIPEDNEFTRQALEKLKVPAQR